VDVFEDPKEILATSYNICADPSWFCDISHTRYSRCSIYLHCVLKLMKYVLGISALYHDSAAALLKEGEIFAAAQEERFTRRKHDPTFPTNAIQYVLKEAEIGLSEIDHVVFYDKPLLKFERLLETYLATAPKGFKSFKIAIPIFLREKLFLKYFLRNILREIDENFSDKCLMFSEHHFSHAASAFYPSPFREAVVLTFDGVGEWATTSVAIGKENDLKIVKEIHFPHSIGLLYAAFTYYIGFKINSGEYKVMGLAPFGEPKYKDLILDKLVDLKEDGSFRLDQSYFNYASGLTMTNQKFEKLFGMPVRMPDKDEISQFHMDIAASIQAVTEEVILKMVRALAKEYNIPNLCMAGGVALNCVVNGKLLRDGSFKDIWIQPAAGDAGGALGCALAVWHQELQHTRKINSSDSMKGSYLGPAFGNSRIESILTEVCAVFNRYSDDELINLTAHSIAVGKVVGWFQGRMEFGPRSLGGRSILGDPRSETMQKLLNLKIKFRESFRPFAPSVLIEDVNEWFELDYDSPYMLLVADVRQSLRREMTDEEKSLFGINKLNIKRSEIPAVTHVDYSARIQTVHSDTNPKYYALISKFKEITGCPVIVNTSFNVRGEPIVCTPIDAFRCFMGTDLDLLVIGNYLLKKEDQDYQLAEDYKNKYKLD
jgi:carbamoyltransferase